MVIYADVLLVVNLYINYLLVRCTALLLRRKITPLRGLAAASVGAAGALAIFLPELHPVIAIFFRVGLGAVVTLVLFGRQKRMDMLISLLLFLAVSFGFAGGMMALWYFAAPLAVLYGGFRLTGYIIKRRRPARHSRVTLKRDGAEISLDGLADTGNSLRDSFSGKPVVLASLAAVRSITPQSAVNYHEGKYDQLEGIRLVPCRTVTAEGLVPVFPAELSVDGHSAEVLIGIAKQDISGADCVFDPSIISK